MDVDRRSHWKSGVGRRVVGSHERCDGMGMAIGLSLLQTQRGKKVSYTVHCENKSNQLIPPQPDGSGMGNDSKHERKVGMDRRVTGMVVT